MVKCVHIKFGGIGPLFLSINSKSLTAEATFSETQLQNPPHSIFDIENSL